MNYILTGFSHDMGFRVFTFECVGEDRLRTKYTVRTDLALTQRYHIPVQELPLLCRGVLERRGEGDKQRTYTYSESDMCLYTEDRANREAQAADKKKPARRPHNENLGVAWRGPTG